MIPDKEHNIVLGPVGHLAPNGHRSCLLASIMGEQQNTHIDNKEAFHTARL